MNLRGLCCDGREELCLAYRFLAMMDDPFALNAHHSSALADSTWSALPEGNFWLEVFANKPKSNL